MEQQQPNWSFAFICKTKELRADRGFPSLKILQWSRFAGREYSGFSVWWTRSSTTQTLPLSSASTPTSPHSMHYPPKAKSNLIHQEQTHVSLLYKGDPHSCLMTLISDLPCVNNSHTLKLLVYMLTSPTRQDPHLSHPFMSSLEQCLEYRKHQ